MIKPLLRMQAVSALTIILSTAASSQIPCVSGFVTDPNGNPVADADLDFDDALTGQRIYTPGDNTDPDGFYTVCVFPGIYHISYAPPPNTNLLGRQFFNVDLSSGSSIELNVTLGFGEIISGVVKDQFDNPVGNVDLDADNLSTGERIYTPNDNSDSLTGEFWIVVPPNFYRLRFEPPRGTRWKGVQIDTLDAHSDTTFDVILEEGFLLSGMVMDEASQGIDSISIDVRDQITGQKLYIAKGETDSTGFYVVAISNGLFELRFEPPRGSRYVGVAVDSFALSGDTIYNQILQSGFLFTALVTDSLDNPIPDADIDFILERTDEKIFTPYDKTDTLGLASFAVLPDTYMVRVQPPPGTLFDRAIMNNVVISSDTTIYFQLAEVDRVNLRGSVKDIAGNGLASIEINLVEGITGNMLLSSDNYTDTLGLYNVDVPLGTFDLVFIPPRGEKIVALKIDEVTFGADTVWDDVILDSGYVFSAAVYDDIEGLPVENVRFDFELSATGETIFTPHNITDSHGSARITLLPETYSIAITTPEGHDYIPPDQLELGLASDTSYVLVLRTQSGPLPERFLLRQNIPNPFNSSTTISYFLFEESHVEITIFNTLGQKIRAFAEGNVNVGEHSVTWDGTDFDGNRVSSSVYFYRIESSLGDKKKKMLLIK